MTRTPFQSAICSYGFPCTVFTMTAGAQYPCQRSTATMTFRGCVWAPGISRGMSCGQLPEQSDHRAPGMGGLVHSTAAGPRGRTDTPKANRRHRGHRVLEAESVVCETLIHPEWAIIGSFCWVAPSVSRSLRSIPSHR